MSDRIETPQGRDVLDESLARLAATGPEFGGGLSNHGPMAAEAMIRLGRPNDVEPWLDRYIRGLEEPPRASDRITDQTWRDALGAGAASPTGNCTCGTSWPSEPWQQVLARWWPRLVPGLAANATHGIIRTSHAARSLAQAPSRASGWTNSPGAWPTGPPGYSSCPGSPGPRAAWTWTPRSAACRSPPGRCSPD